MKMHWTAVVVFAIVCYCTHGFPHGGRKTPVKRSDYTMYDNQFFSVGDTQLDNEVTDCAIVRHQYARGYIRLREYLERLQGCGRTGKLKNIAGIAASTKDADMTSDGFRIPSNNAVRVAPFKPQPIGQLIDNVDKKQTQVQAYHKQAKELSPELPFQQHGLQRSHTQNPSFNNLGFLTQTNGALSYKQNFAANKAVLPVARKFISRKNLNTNPLQGLKTLKNVKYRQQYYMSPDAQRYYSEQTAEVSHAYNGPIAVGQPLLRPNPLAFHQPTSAGRNNVPSRLRMPQVDQPANPDLNMDKNNKAMPQKQQVDAQEGNRHDAVPEPAKPVFQGPDNRVQDDLQGKDDVKDEGNEIGNVQSDPIPSETAFTENPRLEEEEKTHTSQPKMDDSSEQRAPETKQTNDKPINRAGQKSTFNGLTPEETKNNVNPDTQDLRGDMHDDFGGNDKEQSEQPEPNKLNEFLKPDSNTNDDDIENSNAQPADENQPLQSLTKETDQSKKSDENQSDDKGGLTINLDVLKNRISSSKDVGFLKRMLTLIKKITHHKDFHKLAGVQKNAIMQAGKAVNSVVNKSPNTERSFIEPRPVNENPGINTGYYRSPAQSVNSYISSLNQQPHPPHWKLGDRTITGSTQAQFYGGRQHQISKKFQIERYPYYQQPQRVSYTPPYFSLQRLNYGIYNGNTP